MRHQNQQVRKRLNQFYLGLVVGHSPIKDFLYRNKGHHRSSYERPYSKPLPEERHRFASSRVDLVRIRTNDDLLTSSDLYLRPGRIVILK